MTFLSACDVLSLVCRALACPSLLRTPLPPQAARPSLRTAGAAAVDAVPISQLSEAERTTLAEQWGYKSIGAELPNDVTLTDIVKTLPAEARGGGAIGIGWSPAPHPLTLNSAGASKQP